MHHWGAHREHDILFGSLEYFTSTLDQIRRSTAISIKLQGIHAKTPSTAYTSARTQKTTSFTYILHKQDIWTMIPRSTTIPPSFCSLSAKFSRNSTLFESFICARGLLAIAPGYVATTADTLCSFIYPVSTTCREKETPLQSKHALVSTRTIV